MKCFAKRILPVILVLCMAVCCIAPAGAVSIAEIPEWDNEVKTSCGGDCGTSPVIVVPGIMQSQVYVQNKEGEDLLTGDGFPIVEGMDMSFMFDTEALKTRFKDAIGDILKAILKRDRTELFDIVLGILDESFSSHYFNADGSRCNDVDVDEYWYSLAECKEHPEKSYNYAKGYKTDEDGNPLPTVKYETEFDFIDAQVNFKSFCEKYGYDHAYYFAYASFGDIMTSAQKLAEYVEMVKAQTGHDKVSLVFISLGGTIGNVFLSKYADPESIDRVVFAAAAVDGSYLLGDLMGGTSTLDNSEVIYNDLIPNIVAIAAKEYMALAYLGNTVARAIPEDLFSDFISEALTRAIDEVLGNLLHNCQSMWALVPSAQYPGLASKYLSDDAHASLRARTDEYYEIQRNAGATMKRLSDEGMEIFVVCGYNLELPALVEHYNLSADNIIQSSSTSVGGTFANIGETFPEDYKPAIDESYINPDRTVDAGTCALPDRTWFIKNQSHLELQSSVNDVIEMCIQLLTDKDILDARVNNGGYPQFNEYRDLGTVENLVNRCYGADLSQLPDSKREAVEEAYEKALELLESRVWSQEETTEIEKELYTAMYKADMLRSDDTSPFIKYTLLPILEKIMKFISNIFTFIFRGNDYWLFHIPLL